MRAAFYAFLGLLCLLAPSPARSAEPSQTLLIVDATAQMAANLGAKRKIDWVKSTVPATVRRFSAANLVGLWAFGTNPAKKCEGAAELVPLQPASSGAAAIEQKLASVQPNAARTPVVATLRAALKSLGDPAGKAPSVIVIAGAGDDCGMDICAAAKELKTLYPNAKLDVFGLSASQPAADAYTCAAKAMGGSFTAVKNGTDLDHGLRQATQAQQEEVKSKASSEGPVQSNPPSQTATQVVTLERREPGQPNPTPDTAKTPDAAKAPATDKEPAPKDETGEKPAAAAPAPQPEPNVILSAALAPHSPPLQSGVTWRVFKVTVTPTKQLRPAETPMMAFGGGQAKFKLPDGNYFIEAEYGFADAREHLTVAGAKVEKLIPLAAGTIAAEASQAPQGQKAPDAFFKLYRRGRSHEREEVGRSSASPAIFHVNAGDYLLVASAGLARSETPITVLAGKVSAVNLALNAGTLEIKTFAAEGNAKPIPAWHRIFSSQGKAGKPLAIAAGPEQRLQLPEGKYRIETSYGQAVRESAISIKAGEISSETVILNAGEAKIDLGAKTDSICAIYQTGTDHKAEPLGKMSGANVSFFVKAGSYDVECRKKGSPTPVKQAQIRVVAGETQTAKIEE